MNGMEKEIIEVALDDIIPNRFQPRLAFDEKGLNELAESIRQHGIIQPLVLRKVADKFEIIAGERRYKAAYIAGLNKVPAVIIDLNDNESAEVAIVENIQRKDLSPIEEAKSYKKLLDRGYLTQDQLAARMGKTQATISNKLRLLNLDEKVQDALLNNKISERHARSLLRIENKEEQVNILDQIINNKLNVRDTEKIISDKLGENKEDFVSVENISNLVQDQKLEESIEFPKFINDESLTTSPPLDKSNIDSFFEVAENPILKNYSNQAEEIETISDFISPINSELQIQKDEDSDIEVINDIALPFNSIENKDIQIIIDKVNNLINEVKNMGYKIKLEEYDFEELYQFIIKVEKD